MFVANDGAGILKRFEWVVVVVVGGGSPGSFLWSGIVHGLLMVEVKKIGDRDREDFLKGAKEMKRLRHRLSIPVISDQSFDLGAQARCAV